jgi:hypothetical protein
MEVNRAKPRHRPVKPASTPPLWLIPTSATLPELARDRQAALPLDHERRPARGLLRVAPARPDHGPDEPVAPWPERLDPCLTAAASAWSARRQADGAPAADIDPRVQCPTAWQSGLLSALAGRPQGACFAQISSEYELAAEAPWRTALESATEQDDAQQEILLHCIEDVTRNVFHHAGGGARGAHLAWHRQQSANRTTWRVAVADTGKGIVADIRESLKRELQPAEALELAMSQSVSGSKQPGQNRGVGLYVVRNVALRIGGELRIWTGELLLEATTKSPETSHGVVATVANHWPGTLVEFVLRFDNDLRRSRDLIREVVAELDDPTEVERLPIAFFGTVTPAQNAARNASKRATGKRAAVEADDVRAIAEGGHKIAVDRVAAGHIGADCVNYLSENPGRTLKLDFSAVTTISDAYAYALLYPLAPLLRADNPLAVGAATPQVRAALLIAVRALRREQRLVAR